MHYFVGVGASAYNTFAHKPYLLKSDGKVYHFYCAVGDQGRGIAVAVSE